MKQISVYKAQPIIQAMPVESVTITISEQVPTVNSLDAWRDLSRLEAIKLCDALCDALPQGITDALLVELLDRKRTLFVVPMTKKEANP